MTILIMVLVYVSILANFTVSLNVIKEIDLIVGLEFGLHLTSTFSSEVISFKTSSWFGFQSELSLTRLQLPRLCSDSNNSP